MDIKNVHDAKGRFFEILGQTELSQVGVMTIEPGEDSGPGEVHTGDQIVYVAEGEAEVEVNGEAMVMRQGDVLIIPKGTEHHIANRGAKPLFVLTVYTPPQY